MKEPYKTKKQLIEELEALQKQVDKLEKTETRAKQAGKPSLAAQYWQTMFDAIKDAVSIINIEGSITQCNKAMASLLQKPTSEIIGHACWELMHGSTKPIPECPIVRMKKSLKRETRTLPLMGRWFEVTADPIVNKRGKLTGAVHIIVDITEHKRAEEGVAHQYAFLRQVIDSNPNLIFVKDRNDRYLLANRATAETFGTSAEYMLGKTDIELGVLPEEFAKYRQDDIDVLQSGKAKLIPEECYTWPSGEVHYYQTTKQPLFDEKGITIGVLALCVDITERKRAKEALRASEERYRLLFNNVSDALFVHEVSPDDSDPERFRFIEVNDIACQYLGYSREELLQMSILQIDAPETLENIPKILKKLFAEKRATWEGIHVSKDGRRIPVEISIQLFELYGKPMVLSSVRDITERKKMEEQLRDSHEMRVFGQLAAGVAHEVRNPLNAILAITEALFQDIGDNPEYLPYLEHIQNQVNRLSILMNDILEIGKPISQDSFQPETVAEIVTSTIDSWGMIKMSKGHALRFISQSESEKKHLKTDIARFQQVVLNLLQNAAQNSPEGSEIVIQVLEPGDQTVNIHIIDQGTGIPPDNLQHVFEPFFTTQKGGTGLGLSIVKHFVESMGGEVAIWNNDPPPGCTVELRLPIFKDSRKIEIENNSHKNSPPLAGGDKGEG